MGSSGYTSLSLDEKRYKTMRKNWDNLVNTDKSFTIWASDVLDNAIAVEGQVASMFPAMKFVGMTSNGCVIQDGGKLVEIIVKKNTMTCAVDKGICNHCLFAARHPLFGA